MTLRKRLYQAALKVMFRIPPEKIHGLVSDGLGVLHFCYPVNRIMGRLTQVNDPALEQQLFGVTFRRPLGLAAGFDKNAACADAWSALGFGYAELGTITASPQPGNPAPRLFRLPKDKALLNRMGFNNQGAAAAARHLYRRNSSDVVGINIGKTKVVPAEHAVSDYHTSATLLGDLADFLVVNVSSPNTPGLRDLQATDQLRPILETVLESTDSPVLVKIAPDLSDEGVDAVADLAVELGLAGIVATNTTISREGLQTPSKKVERLGDGGISGPPVADRALEVLHRLHERVGDDLVLVAVGGISTPQQAWERIAAGASLLQGYTGFIYGGPDWIRDIHRGLLDQLERHGMESISEAVGCELPWRDEN